MVAALVQATALTPFPGAPFSDAVVTAAAAQVRSDAGWHIAPTVTETLVVDSDGRDTLELPTLKLLAVTAVRHVTSSGTTVLTGWEPPLPNGIVRRRGGWPHGRIEVDCSHGYDDCPPDLLPVIAERCVMVGTDASRVAAQSAGPFSTTYREPSTTVAAALARYVLPPSS